MKIRAGKKLWRRNPTQAPATIAESTAASTLPSDSAITAKVTPEIAQTPEASPSMPSRKLTMFITATIQTIVSGTPIHGGTSTAPRNGSVKWSIQTPNAVGIAAASTWPASFDDRRQPAEVVDRADDAGDRGAEQDAAHLAREVEERERRDEDAEEDREPAEPRDRAAG